MKGEYWKVIHIEGAFRLIHGRHTGTGDYIDWEEVGRRLAIEEDYESAKRAYAKAASMAPSEEVKAEYERKMVTLEGLK